MVMRRSAVAFVLLAAGILGCSKTQDTAPERRIFGNPPAIQGVSLVTSEATATCDITDVVKGYLCSFNLTPDVYAFSPGPNVAVQVTYSQLKFEVRVTDAESTPDQSDILLVSASYTTPADAGQTPEETSLLLLDDGSENTFPFRQGGGAPEACTMTDPVVTCPGDITCVGAEYDLTTNDVTKGDDLFTRGFAFVAPGANVPANGFALVENCVARANKQAPASGSKFVGTDVDFKVEAVDRSGNLSVWPERPRSSVGFSGLTCLGDLCACCLLTTSEPEKDPPVGCRGLEGLIGVPGTGFEAGLCKLF